MALPAALRELPGDLIPGRLAGASGERAISELVFERRRSENMAYCHTLVSVYSLHRSMYADQEAEYLAGPGDYAAAVAARRRLSAAAEALQAQVSTLLRVGQTAASHVIEVAIGMVERVPQVFALVGRNVISAKAAETALGASRTLTAEQVRQFDAALADRLTVEYEVLSLPAFREAADLLVKRIDPEAVERRRSLAEQDRRITFRPAEDGMAAAFALLPAADMSEVSARVEYIAGTVCDADPRTVPQRQADGFAQLIRGYSTLGCLCGAEGCKYRTARYAGEPDADGAVTRFITMINVVVNERGLVEPAPAEASAAGRAAADRDTAESAESGPGPAPTASAPTASAPAGFAYLAGYGPIAAEHARELAARSDAKVREFGERIPKPFSTPGLDAECPAAVSDTAQASGTADAEAPHGTIDFAWEWAQIVLGFVLHSGPDGGAGPDSFAGPDGPAGGGPDGGAPDGGAPDGGDAPDPGGSPDGGGGPPRGGGGSGPDPGPQDPRALVRARGSSGYRPSADLFRYVRLVFPRCVFPFCGRPASRAQIDHRTEFDHRDPGLGGATTAEQLQPLCVPHHQLKTAGAWIDARLPDGRILWTSPHGRRYIVDPSGIVLQLFPDLLRVQWLIPDGAVPGSVVSARGRLVPEAAHSGGRTRLQREHARRERLRERNVAALLAEQSAAAQSRSAVEDSVLRAIGVTPPLPRMPTDDEPPPY